MFNGLQFNLIASLVHIMCLLCFTICLSCKNSQIFSHDRSNKFDTELQLANLHFKLSFQHAQDRRSLNRLRMKCTSSAHTQKSRWHQNGALGALFEDLYNSTFLGTLLVLLCYAEPILCHLTPPIPQITSKLLQKFMLLKFFRIDLEVTSEVF